MRKIIPLHIGLIYVVRVLGQVVSHVSPCVRSSSQVFIAKKGTMWLPKLKLCTSTCTTTIDAAKNKTNLRVPNLELLWDEKLTSAYVNSTQREPRGKRGTGILR